MWDVESTCEVHLSFHSILNISLLGRKWTPIILYDTDCSQSFTLTNREMISFSSFLSPFLHFCWEPHFKSPEHSREGKFHRKRGRWETWKVRAYFSFPRTTSQSSPMCFLSSFLTLPDLSWPSNRKHFSVCSVLGARWYHPAPGNRHNSHHVWLEEKGNLPVQCFQLLPTIPTA